MPVQITFVEFSKVLYIVFLFVWLCVSSRKFFFVQGDGWILLAIRFKDKNLVCIRFVSYFHQLHEKLNELVHSPYSFKNTFRRVSDQSSFITGGGRGEIEGFWLCLIHPKALQYSKDSPYLRSMIRNFRLLYEYLRLCITLLFMNTKRYLQCIMLHYFVKIQNVKMSMFEQKKHKTYSYFVSLNSVFKDTTIRS